LDASSNEHDVAVQANEAVVAVEFVEVAVVAVVAGVEIEPG
jgi:hypothetical protein